jgi:uncharacterized protein involved in type VI secretion and phage assembly
MTQFFGKYRGSVANNIDPLRQGRLQVNVPAVLGDGSLSWAMPCVPYAGSGVGFFTIPPVGANVWIEFEAGNPDYPIWSGCFWASGELPTEATLPMVKLIKTDTATFKLDDTPGAGGVSIELTSGARIAVNATGIIEIDNGQGASIQISGPNVSVNNGALEVT